MDWDLLLCKNVIETPLKPVHAGQSPSPETALHKYLSPCEDGHGVPWYVDMF
jgi:hypothetical protein